jgi:formate/nitrite transporter
MKEQVQKETRPDGPGLATTVHAARPVDGATAWDYVRPLELVAEAIAAANAKARLPTSQLLLRGMLAGALLGFATSLAAVAWAQGLPRLVGALVFPVGFVLLVLLGLELATGNFALLPMGVADRRLSLAATARNWAWAYVGNLLGCLLYAALFYLAITDLGLTDGGPLGEQLRRLALAKTIAYADEGARGWALALVKGVLANWMVTVGAVMAFVSRSVGGKVLAMWLPIMTFFALGYEHSIVNMFVVPAGMMLGADVSLADWWLWNQVPVTLGNVLGSALLTGLALYGAHRPVRPPGAGT